jgi:hypothetical protein
LLLLFAFALKKNRNKNSLSKCSSFLFVFLYLLLQGFAVREERKGVKNNKRVPLYSYHSLSTLISYICYSGNIAKRKMGNNIPHKTLEQKQQSQQETKHG